MRHSFTVGSRIRALSRQPSALWISRKCTREHQGARKIRRGYRILFNEEDRNENQSNPSGRWNPGPAGLWRGFRSVAEPNPGGRGLRGRSAACGFWLARSICAGRRSKEVLGDKCCQASACCEQLSEKYQGDCTVRPGRWSVRSCLRSLIERPVSRVFMRFSGRGEHRMAETSFVTGLPDQRYWREFVPAKTARIAPARSCRPHKQKVRHDLLHLMQVPWQATLPR